MKLRISNTLKARADNCADAIYQPLAGFVRLAVSCEKSGKLSGVVHDENLIATTREESTVITINGLEDDPAYVRRCISRAVTFAEPRNPRPFDTRYREGVDYLVGASA